jgi:hypothetical protein
MAEAAARLGAGGNLQAQISREALTLLNYCHIALNRSVHAAQCTRTNSTPSSAHAWHTYSIVRTSTMRTHRSAHELEQCTREQRVRIAAYTHIPNPRAQCACTANTQ